MSHIVLMSHCSKLDKMSHCSRLWELEGPGGSWKEPGGPWVLIMDPTVWLDGARPANTCFPPSFPWIRHEEFTSKVVLAPPWPPL